MIPKLKYNNDLLTLPTGQEIVDLFYSTHVNSA